MVNSKPVWRAALLNFCVAIEALSIQNKVAHFPTIIHFSLLVTLIEYLWTFDFVETDFVKQKALSMLCESQPTTSMIRAHYSVSFFLF